MTRDALILFSNSASRGTHTHTHTQEYRTGGYELTIVRNYLQGHRTFLRNQAFKITIINDPRIN